MWSRCSARGFTLIEMIIAIVVLGIGLVGVLAAYQTVVRGSADALVGKQLIAIAEEMMEEVLLKPYAPPAGSTGAGQPGGDCAGPGSAADRSGFDEVLDYNGYQTPDVCGIDGNPVVGLEDYGVVVAVQSNVTMSGIANTLLVTVTASRGTQTFALQGVKVLLPLPPSS